MTRSRFSGFCVAALACVLGWLTGGAPSYGYDGPWPLLFDWCSNPHYYTADTWRSPNMDQYGFQTVYTQYNPHTFVAHDGPWNLPAVLGAYDKMMEQNRPVTLTLLHTAAPITGTNDPLGLQKTIDYLSGKGYRLDFLVDQCVVVELKAVDNLHPIHEAQLLTYLKLGGWSVGLLINFNVPLLKDGIKRIVHNFKENSENSARSAPLR